MIWESGGCKDDWLPVWERLLGLDLACQAGLFASAPGIHSSVQVETSTWSNHAPAKPSLVGQGDPMKQREQADTIASLARFLSPSLAVDLRDLACDILPLPLVQSWFSPGTGHPLLINHSCESLWSSARPRYISTLVSHAPNTISEICWPYPSVLQHHPHRWFLHCHYHHPTVLQVRRPVRLHFHRPSPSSSTSAEHIVPPC